MNKEITSEEISKLSDEELRVELIHQAYPSFKDGWYKGFLEGNNGDYLNNWNHLMPLVVEHYSECEVLRCRDRHLVRMIDAENKYVVHSGGVDLRRVLAECLLQVLISKEDKNE